MRLGIYGGSFDPVHYGHLLLAETCREQARLDEVWFMPAAVAPHKQHQSVTSAKQRVDMLELAIAGHAQLRVSTLEVDRGGTSYTVDTLKALQADRPGDDLFLLVGGDTLADLPNWRAPQQILEIATPLAVARHGAPPPHYSVLNRVLSPERMRSMERIVVEMPIIELSGRDIRERVASGRSIRFRTPRAVEKYIETHNLYRST